MLGNIPYCIFSFGGGVQSSAIYLMLMNEPHRLLEVMKELPDKVYFADTGAETASTYEALKHMNSYDNWKYQIETVRNGNILESKFFGGDYHPLYPFYVKKANGEVGFTQRKCTSEYKVRAIQSAARGEFGLKGKPLTTPTVSTWLGISTDEVERLKFTEGEGFVLRYPLIELNMSRQECIDYCIKYNWKPTKSRCWMCPCQSDVNWIDLKVNHPDDFEKACIQDERIRDVLTTGDERIGKQSNGSKIFLHRSCVPLREVVFKEKNNTNEFLNECQGMCGT